MTTHYLSRHFDYFFGKLNPNPTTRSIASSQYNSVKGILEDRNGAAGRLDITCFLQGSHDRSTSIYTINDLDIVALSRYLSYPGSGSGSTGSDSWGRDRIFTAIATALRGNYQYAGKVHYTPQSMCVKIDLGIKVEILPAVMKSGNSDPATEPFVLYRPETGIWEDGYARLHQAYLTVKNYGTNTGGNFIPMIKVLKHLRSLNNLDAVSFHLECLLYSLDNKFFTGSPVLYIPYVLNAIAITPAAEWYGRILNTPCRDRDIFTSREWERYSFYAFHAEVVKWASAAYKAFEAQDETVAISRWKDLLGDNFFPWVAQS